MLCWKLPREKYLKLDALLRVPRQSLYWEALAILQLSLNVLYLKSCEIQSNRCAQVESMCSSYSAFDCISWNRVIAYYSFTGPLPRKMSQDRYVSLWTFQPIFFSLCRCCCLFVSFLKQERHFEFLSYGGSWHRATMGSVNLFKIIRGISQVWENSQT